jgi:signal transduction histidine kinase
LQRETAQPGVEEAGGAEAVSSALERRLDRLRFDLHDGPLQDVHLLAIDLGLFREQLLPSLETDPNRDRLVGRLEDLAAQLAALDGDLRRLVATVESPFHPSGAMPDAVAELARAFADRTGIQPRTEIGGDFSALSDSQQIALLAVIREALSNIRQHSEASSVTISVASHERGVDAEVIDDGRGFDPETTRPAAAEGGHLGLLGMSERVRMLGGETRIDSRPGGPTVISIKLPPRP